ncbi:MAG: hypothetical protein Q9173_005523 [Seirophora scorigena]
MARTKVIIDTDPGTDDVLALLYALSCSSEDLEVLLISVAFGNVDVQNCLRNAVSMFRVIEKERQWRKEHGRLDGFDALKHAKPIVAVGADEPLGGERMKAAYYHGADGLGGIHSSHPHHSSPSETWKHLFDLPPPGTLLTSTAASATHTDPPSATHNLFTPSSSPSHLEILRILDAEPPDTITLIAIGPLTTFATAAAHAPQTFLRAKELLVMGGAVEVPGNMTPVGEFNTIADAAAAARVYALTSPEPESTMPPFGEKVNLPGYPNPGVLGDRRLKLVMFPLDITTRHTLRRDEVYAKLKPLCDSSSPLAEWVLAILDATFKKVESLHQGHDVGGDATYVSMHDPLCIWYAATGETQADEWRMIEGEDIRIETVGQWTRGMCVVDRRDRKKGREGEKEVEGDMGEWLSWKKGNRERQVKGLWLVCCLTVFLGGKAWEEVKTFREDEPISSISDTNMAPTSTEKRWFTTDHEWSAATFDYAVARMSTDYIRQAIRLHDHRRSHFDFYSNDSPTFLEIHEEFCAGYGPSFTLYDDILVFSDVDQSNPNHEKDLRAKIARTKPLKQPTEQSNAVKEKLIQHLVKTMGKHPPLSEPFMTVEEREPYFREIIEYPDGVLSHPFLKFITHLDSREEKHEALMLLSGQAPLPASIQRPVIVLASVVDTAQSTAIGESAGYITGYDILADKLIIKRYVSNDTRHFLADKWSTENLPADDEIAFAGTPMDFVRNCLPFVQSMTAADAAPTEADGFKYLVWADVAEWLWYHAPALPTADRTDADRELIAEIEKACRSRNLKRKFEDLPFPLKQKKEKEGEAGQERKEDELDRQVEGWRETVGGWEPFMRSAAKKALEEGKEAKAKAAARLWDRVREAFEEFEVVAGMEGMSVGQ